MGDAGIQAYSNNTPTPSKLYLQYNGGDLDIGKSGHTGTTTIYGPLNYAGFSAASDNADRVVWFSYNGTIGRPVYDNDFKYNPSTNRLTLGRLYLTNTEGVTHIQFSRANYNYVIAPTGGSIAFGANGATGGTQVSLVVSASQVIPGHNNGSIDLGSPDYAWKSLYTRNVYWDDGNGKQNAYTSYTSGTASTTEGTNGTQGYFNLFLGNSTAISSTVGQGAGNSRGRLYIYGRYGYSSNITSNAADSNKNIDIPNYSGYMLIGNNTVTNPTEDTTYYIPFYLTVHQRTSANNGLRYRTLEGTTSTTGYGGIYLGNSTASGTAGNKYGFIRMYASNSNFTTILSQGNGNRDFYLPNYAGDMYAVHAGNNNAVGSSTLPVYVAANGRVTACGTSLAVSVTGNASSATYLKDKTNGTASYLDYGSSGMTSASWYGAWDGYTLRAISPANLATHLATNTLDARYVNASGDSMSGPLQINTSLQDHSSPTTHCLVINSSTGTPTLKNAPGIGFYIANVNWGSLIFDNNGFKFINSNSDGYMPVYASTFYGNLSGNASTATSATSASVLRTDDTMKLYAQYSNEVNFGGTNTSSTIFFGYRAADSKPIPTDFIFGGSTGTATITAATFNGSATKLGGLTKAQLTPYSTKRDFASGTLIYTDINYAVTNGDPFYMEIKGNTYGDVNSCFTQVQGYIYNDTIINYGVTHLGKKRIGDIYCMNIGGNLCFWFPRLAYWHGYSIFCSTGYDYSKNRVTNVVDSGDPGGTKRVNLSTNTVRNMTSANFSLSGTTLTITTTT